MRMRYPVVALLPLLLAACSGGKSTPFSSAPSTPLVSTAQANVSLLGAPMAMPGLNRSRQVRLYLPPSYATSDKRYPVLYMHDGQNVFDQATAYAGEWKVDETLNALAAGGKLEVIVVAIDNGQEKRMQELSPWTGSAGPAEGNQYLDFIVNTVKPLVDSRYRTLPDRTNTAIMGSSMGGLISHYALVRHPTVFGKAGVFSPSYWYSSASFDYFNTTPAARDARLYLLMGEGEGQMVPDVRRVHGYVQNQQHPAANVTLRIAPGEHSEAFWAGEFERAITWLFAAQ